MRLSHVPLPEDPAAGPGVSSSSTSSDGLAAGGAFLLELDMLDRGGVLALRVELGGGRQRGCSVGGGDGDDSAVGPCGKDGGGDNGWSCS